ncbi:MAG: hypothetical protein HN742_30710 [Lentisphaerae bacterium]|nr:hypothetical protein [Lentisphaerota bacterium]MBT4820475.1 hypothetical protein [Lentisphaerota bacterium]MBT5606323.1 hypothetical protein [Lentisphaerota bacterium]MBT7059603.1 hypothetical protein [Lentisphaerota bacterium]MBT7846283.1 hypothetical protein [Lentisphaerota bacterium]
MTGTQCGINALLFLAVIVSAVHALADQATSRSRTGAPETVAKANSNRLQPYTKNPRYWQYRGQPVLLLGGSKTDHIFLANDLEAHLDEMQEVGANYVRCTMSQREGPELKPHRRLPDGIFDLGQWNEDYWIRFANCLKWCDERDIIIQIEVWDRFDFSKTHWASSPWNPKNNVNYTYGQTGFAMKYARHSGQDQQPFFHSIKGMTRYGKKLDLIRMHQEAFVGKMLSYSLPYGNVLYCMDNETSTPAAWGQYWIQFIKAKAAEKGVSVCTTDMFDDAFEADKAEHTPIIFRDAEHYMFADISQVNSRNYDEAHWTRLLWLLRQINRHPRPSNHTKIYGSGYKSFGTGGPEDGVERFWRNIFGGSASARFHRPDSGNGLNDHAKASIKAARILESLIKFWDITPQMGLLSNRASNEAYLAAEPGRSYALYFTKGGSVGLDLSGATGSFNVTWISVSMGVTTRTSRAGGYRLMDRTIQGGSVVTLSAPYKGGWVAAIVKK